MSGYVAAEGEDKADEEVHAQAEPNQDGHRCCPSVPRQRPDDSAREGEHVRATQPVTMTRT